MAHTAQVTQTIPEYLQPYIVRQDASLYTPMDHAAWRFILKISRGYFARHAHQKYLDGLRETGISPERIPLIEEMDERLRRFGWRAVAVSGFIPPAVFMEFLSRGILPIACDMRKIENLAYTPAPDIVHEAAGHAPIIADPEYAQYLRNYGELAEKAIFSSQDMEVYLAIRNLSDVKEDPASTPERISDAQARLDRAVAAVDYVSEATQLARMSWWTIEYGLVGDPTDPKIYGAGLLSSVGESYHCLGDEVKKVPFSLDCINMTYDITRPQPQLYLAPDFQSLSRVLGDLAATMAYRLGGVEGLDRAKRARTVTTTVLDSGLQISGILTEYFVDEATGKPSFLKFAGPSQISRGGAQLEGQGADYHREGYSTPVGPLRATGRSARELGASDLGAAGLTLGKASRLEFASGIVIEGKLESRVERDGRTDVLTFTDCTVRKGNEVLYRPDWGPYDLACGDSVVSVFGGPADRRRYLADTGGYNQAPAFPKTNLTDENRELNLLYAKVRAVRESARAGDALPAIARETLAEVLKELDARYPDEWLLRYELLELDLRQASASPWRSSVRARLDAIARAAKSAPAGDQHATAELIARGLQALEENA